MGKISILDDQSPFSCDESNKKNCCELPLKNPKDQENIQEATARLAPAKEFSVNAAAAKSGWHFHIRRRAKNSSKGFSK